MGAPFELVKNGHVSFEGEMRAPGATPGNVLTVNADESVSPAAGGGSQPQVTVAQGLPTSSGVCSSFGITWNNAACTSGHYKLAFDFGSGTETTAFINFDATLAEIIAAIEALPTPVPGDVVLAPGTDSTIIPLTQDPFVEVYLVFVGALAGVTIATPTVTGDTTDGGAVAGANQDYPIATLDANTGDVWIDANAGTSPPSGSSDIRATLGTAVYIAAIIPSWQIWVNVNQNSSVEFAGACNPYYVPS
jgi:hypothetical protein